MTAAAGEEGLRAAREQQPDAITLDVLMPGMDGWAVLRTLKSDPEVAGIPVVMITMVDGGDMGTRAGRGGLPAQAHRSRAPVGRAAPLSGAAAPLSRSRDRGRCGDP